MATFSVHIDGVLLYKLCQAQSTVLGYREYYMAINFGDTNFIFEHWKYLSQVSEVNELEILSAREDKIRILKPPCNVLFIL